MLEELLVAGVSLFLVKFLVDQINSIRQASRHVRSPGPMIEADWTYTRTGDSEWIHVAGLDGSREDPNLSWRIDRAPTEPLRRRKLPWEPPFPRPASRASSTSMASTESRSTVGALSPLPEHKTPETTVKADNSPSPFQLSPHMHDGHDETPRPSPAPQHASHAHHLATESAHPGITHLPGEFPDRDMPPRYEVAQVTPKHDGGPPRFEVTQVTPKYDTHVVSSTTQAAHNTTPRPTPTPKSDISHTTDPAHPSATPRRGISPQRSVTPPPRRSTSPLPLALPKRSSTFPSASSPYPQEILPPPPQGPLPSSTLQQTIYEDQFPILPPNFQPQPQPQHTHLEHRPSSRAATSVGSNSPPPSDSGRSSKPKRSKPRGMVRMTTLICAILLFIFGFAVLIAHCLAWFIVYKTEARLGEAKSGLLRGGEMRMCLCARG